MKALLPKKMFADDDDDDDDGDDHDDMIWYDMVWYDMIWYDMMILLRCGATSGLEGRCSKTEHNQKT